MKIVFGNFKFSKKLYITTLAVFIILIAVVDKNNLVEFWKLKGKISALEEQKKYYLEKISEDSMTLKMLDDDKYIEKFARENYLMKAPGETIYIVNE